MRVGHMVAHGLAAIPFADPLHSSAIEGREWWLRLEGTFLRALGHDLHGILTRVRAISGSWVCHPLHIIAPGSNEWTIIDHLNEFAKSTRYFNLDTLTSNKAGLDPLRRWTDVLEQITRTDVPLKRRQRLSESALRVERAVASDSLHFLDPEAQAAAWQLHSERGRFYEVAAGYAAHRIMRILDGLKSVLSEVTRAAQARERDLTVRQPVVPHMTEFLSFVYADDPEYTCKQRIWP